MSRPVLSNLRPAKNSRKKMKRIGRGQGSGHGGTSTRGHKGAGSRSGAKFRVWFEGGQMPLTRRVPKFGFHPRGREEMQVVNVGQLEEFLAKKKFKGSTVSPETLYQAGLISTKKKKVKILATGDVTSKFEVSVHAVSKAAQTKIEAAGGTVSLIAEKTETAAKADKTDNTNS